MGLGLHCYSTWTRSGRTVEMGGLCLAYRSKNETLFFLSSKTALLEGLEVDQYMWGILNAIQQ